jgi:cytochrome c peroxidase
MPALRGLPRIGPCVVFLTLLAGAPGCDRAARYGPAPSVPPPPAPPPTPSAVRQPEPLDPGLLWQDGGPVSPADVPLEFVHATVNPEEWNKLPRFWNAPLLSRPDQAATVIGLSPLAAGAVAGGSSSAVVRVKVPLGLDDPRPFFPAANPPTLRKWELGKALFFDSSWLEAGAEVSCATCHRPQDGFADRRRVEREAFNVATLLNGVYNTHQFWDGRVAYLEEVVQRSLEDERAPAGSQPFRHVWGGVVGRLRERSKYNYEFDKVFGTPPTMDAVGKAVATYLRTLLCGNSVHDRALQARVRRANREPAAADSGKKNDRGLTAADYETVLDDAALVELGHSGAKKADVAGELLRGYRLFYSLDEKHRVNCAACHVGNNFTDGGFHNLGLDREPVPGQETGRFVTAPLGEKNRYLIGAYKTPTLRSLLRTGPYYHDGSAEELDKVVFPHATGTRYLDPELRVKDHIRGWDLEPEEIKALVLFLRSLNGELPDFP